MRGDVGYGGEMLDSVCEEWEGRSEMIKIAGREKERKRDRERECVCEKGWGYLGIGQDTDLKNKFKKSAVGCIAAPVHCKSLQLTAWSRLFRCPLLKKVK